MGKIDEQLSNIPKPTYHRDKDKLIKHLDDSYRGMLKYVISELSKGVNEQSLIREIEIMKQVNVWMAQLDADMAKGLDNLIKKTFKEGQAYHLLAVGDATTWEDALSKASFNRVQRAKMEALLADTYEDILMATQHTSAAIKNVVRSTVSKVAQYHSLRNNHYDEQAKDLYSQLSKKGLSENIQKKGFVGIVDKAGRKWDLKVYSNMVIKTKTNQAFIEGTIHEAQESGIDLAIISDHSADDACSKWEGVIISMTGATKGYPTYAEARATNQIFHPNCEHTFHPVRNLKLIHPDDLKTAQQKAKALQLTPPRKPRSTQPKEVKVDQDVLKPTELTHENIKLERNFKTQVNKKIGKEAATTVYDMLDKAPPLYQKVWGKYQDAIIYKRNGGDRAYYRSGEGVTMSMDSAIRGKSYQKPYQVFFHEFAHNIDAEANKTHGNGVYWQGISYTYENKKFDKALRKDFATIKTKTKRQLNATIKQKLATGDIGELKRMGVVTPDQWRAYLYDSKQLSFEDLKNNITDALISRAIQDEIRKVPLIELGNISDIFEGLSHCEIRGGIGHGSDYWLRDSSLSSEAFAEFYDSMIANKESFAHMKHYFPNGLAVFEEILEFITQEGN